MKQYLDLVQHVLDTGTRKENRTGVDTISTFNHNYEIDLREGFPLLTTKMVSWKNIVVELLWFLSGATDISILKRHGCKFWDAWADPETGKVPSAYGNFWRQFPVHTESLLENSNEFGDILGPPTTHREPAFNDQIAWVLGELKRNPMSRRMVVSAWAPGNAQTSKLPPCHSIFMLNVQNGLPLNAFHYGHDDGLTPVCGRNNGLGILPHGVGMRKGAGLKWCPDCQDELQRKTGQSWANPEPNEDSRRLCLHLTQRSADVFLGVPYNIASYALLLQLFSQFSGIEPGIFGHSLVDAHLYTCKADGSMAEYDHVPAVREQLTREPKPLPKLKIDPSLRDLKDVEGLMDPKLTTAKVMSHFVLEGYDPGPALAGKVAV